LRASKDLDTHTGALCLVRDLGGLGGTYFQARERSCMRKHENGRIGCRDFSRPTQKPKKSLPAHISITECVGPIQDSGGGSGGGRRVTVQEWRGGGAGGGGCYYTHTHYMSLYIIIFVAVGFSYVYKQFCGEE